jgi:DNA-binding response OmpR family regulator
MSRTAPILVVEDDDAIRALLAAALRRESLDVDTAVDGGEALRLTSSCEYAVILLDLMMPELNGFDFLEAFHRASPRGRSLILVITAFDERVCDLLSPLHVHAVLRKPFDVMELAGMLRDLVHAWQRQMAASGELPRTGDGERLRVR